jgi:hypothetical protein
MQPFDIKGYKNNKKLLARFLVVNCLPEQSLKGFPAIDTGASPFS